MVEVGVSSPSTGHRRPVAALGGVSVASRLWAEYVVGATTEESYVAGFEAAGLRSVEVLSRSDYFAGSSSPETRKVAASFGAHAIVLRAKKP